MRAIQPKLLPAVRRRPWHSPYLLTLVPLLCLGSYGSWWYVRARYLEPREHWRAAQRALERRHFAEALGELKPCVQAWPQDAASHFLFARTARRAGELALAVEHLMTCQRLTEKNPGTFDGDTNLEWSLLHAQRGKLPEVESDLRSRLAENHPDSTFILETLSAELIRGNRLAEARACLGRWLERQPNDYQAHVLHGWVLEHERLDYGSAARDFAEALRLDPEQDSLRLHLAELLIETSQLSDALEQVEILRRRQPDNLPVRVQLAHIYRSQGRFADAGKLLDHVLARQPRNGPALSERGILALQSQRPPAEAERFLRQALDLNPTHRPTLYNLQVCLELQGKREEAGKLRDQLAQREAELKRLNPLTRAVLDKPQDPDLRSQVGMIFLRNGYTEDGLRWLGTALKRDPHHRPTHEALADYYEHAGALDRAAWHRRFLSP